MIETTHMKFGQGPGRIIWVTTQRQTLKVWAKSRHIQNKLLHDLEYLGNKDQSPNQVHKKETKAHNKDRKKLENFIKTCIHPLDVESNNENVYTGEIAAADVNFNKAFENGCSQLKSFKGSLLEGFRSTIKILVVPIGSKIQANEQSYN